MHFGDRLRERCAAAGSPTCVGLDPHLDRLPSVLDAGANRGRAAAAAEAFCVGVIEAVADVVAAVKPQSAFFEQLGSAGVAALERVVAAARRHGLIAILDAKRGDIGSTAAAYARATLDDDGPLGADAVTLSPYLGPESLRPFAERCADGKGLFVLVRTSNPGAGPWQGEGAAPGGIASRVAAWIEAANEPFEGPFGPVGAVVGATLGDESAAWRAAMPRTWFLAPGYGEQGARAADLASQLTPRGAGSLVVSARAVLYPASGADGAAWQQAVRDRARAFAADVGSSLGTRR